MLNDYTLHCMSDVSTFISWLADQQKMNHYNFDENFIVTVPVVIHKVKVMSEIYWLWLKLDDKICLLFLDHNIVIFLLDAEQTKKEIWKYHFGLCKLLMNICH